MRALGFDVNYFVPGMDQWGVGWGNPTAAKSDLDASFGSCSSIEIQAIMSYSDSELMESGTVWSDGLLSQPCAAYLPLVGRPQQNLINDEEVISAIFSGGDSFCNLSCSGESLDQHQFSRNEAASQFSLNPPPRSNFDARRRSGECLLEKDGLQVVVASRNRKRLRSEKHSGCARTISFNGESGREANAEVKEMIYRAAALRPVSLGAEEAVDTPKRKNVKISSDPQTVAARHRRERISERLRVLQRLVPGGTKLDTATMLDEAANYLKFLKSQVRALETRGNPSKTDSSTSAAAAAAAAAAALMRPSFPLALNHQACSEPGFHFAAT